MDHLRAKDDGPVNTAFIDFQPAERAITATQAVIKYKGDRAFYHRGGDYIQMPPKNKFPKESDFYATSFHELAHWSENGPVGKLIMPSMSCGPRLQPQACFPNCRCLNPKTLATIRHT